MFASSYAYWNHKNNCFVQKINKKMQIKIMSPAPCLMPHCSIIHSIFITHFNIEWWRTYHITGSEKVVDRNKPIKIDSVIYQPGLFLASCREEPYLLLGVAEVRLSPVQKVLLWNRASRVLWSSKKGVESGCHRRSLLSEEK